MYSVQVWNHAKRAIETIKTLEVEYTDHGILFSEIGYEQCELFVPYTALRMVAECDTKKDTNEATTLV